MTLAALKRMRKDWRAAAMTGDAAAVGRLLGEGCDPDARDRYGQTALMLAATRGHDAVVAALLRSGAERDVTAKYGLSALMLAAVNRHESTARLLADAGANLSLTGTGAPGFHGRSAADLARDAGLTELVAYLAASRAR